MPPPDELACGEQRGPTPELSRIGELVAFGPDAEVGECPLEALDGFGKLAHAARLASGPSSDKIVKKRLV